LRTRPLALAATCANLIAVNYKFDTNTLDKVTALVRELQDGVAAVDAAMASNGHGSVLAHAKHYCDQVRT
jgi:glutamine synthetase